MLIKLARLYAVRPSSSSLQHCFSTSIQKQQARVIEPDSTLRDHQPLIHHNGGRKKAKEALQAIDQIQSAPPTPFLIDRFSRQHTYLRISLAEKCNFRCLYCMPAEGVPLTPKNKLLTATELERLAHLFVSQGINKIRLTGGEPTVRKDLPEIIAALSSQRQNGLRQIGMTTNGLTLSRHLPNLVANGLTHLNISLDTLDPFKFELMTRTAAKGMEKVLNGIDYALALGVPNVKINVVVIRGLNDGKDVLDFVEWAKDRDVTVRFIEYMPFDGNKWRPEKLVPYSQLLENITEQYGPLEKVVDDTNDTSKHWKVPGHQSRLGFITSMTEHFCGTCNRLRITADGNLKVCLFGNAEVSLRDAMRSGLTGFVDGPANDDQLLHIIGAAVKRKHAKHAGMADPVDLAKAPLIRKGIPQRSVVSIPSHMLRNPLSSIRHVRMYSTIPPHGPWDNLDADFDKAASDNKREMSQSIGKSQPIEKNDSPVTWSEYMGVKSDDDSPWANLDAFADGVRQDEASTQGITEGTSLRNDAHRVPSMEAWEEAAIAAADAYAARQSKQQSMEYSRMPMMHRESDDNTSQASEAPRLTHIDIEHNDRAAMVDVSDKQVTKRVAIAKCRVHIPAHVLPLLEATQTTKENGGSMSQYKESVRLKGPVLHTAQLAGIMAAKKTSDLIPLCHGLNLSHVDVQLNVHQMTEEELEEESSNLSAYIEVICTTTTASNTGVEMEALTGASVASLTLWDMLKSVSGKEMRIDGLMVTQKSGGKSGDWQRWK